MYSHGFFGNLNGDQDSPQTCHCFQRAQLVHPAHFPLKFPKNRIYADRARSIVIGIGDKPIKSQAFHGRCPNLLNIQHFQHQRVTL